MFGNDVAACAREPGRGDQYRYPKLTDRVVFYQVDESEGRTRLVDINPIIDPDQPPGGSTFRQQANIPGQAAEGRTHEELRVCITTNLHLDEFRNAVGGTPAQWGAFLRRCTVIDTYARGPWPVFPPVARLDPRRVAATLIEHAQGLAFPRQDAPRAAGAVTGLGDGARRRTM